MVEVGEEPREIPVQGKVGTTESFMDVAPLSLAFIAVGALLQKCAPSSVPLIECRGEFLSRCPREREGDDTQLLPGFELRTPREFLRHRLELMELALLDGNLGIPLLKHLPDTFPAVGGEGSEPESRRFQGIEAAGIVLHLLTRDFPPIQIPSVGATDKHAIGTREEGCIHDQVHRLLFDDDFPGCRSVGIEMFSEGLGVFAVRSMKVIVRLSSLRVLVICTLHPSFLLPVSTDKYAVTDLAFVPLSAGLPTISP